MLTLKSIRAAVTHHSDTVGKRKDGSFIIRHGYYYRNGVDADKFAKAIEALLTAAGLEFTTVDKGDHWAAFRGGASTANSSHFWITVAPKNVE